MQLRNQNGMQKNWKVVAAVTAASAIGLSGLALASPSDGAGKPDPIQLRERTAITQVTTSVTDPGIFNTVLSASVDSTNDSPFTDSLMTESVTPSMESDTHSPETELMSALDESDSPSQSIDTDSISASLDSSFDS